MFCFLFALLILVGLTRKLLEVRPEIFFWLYRHKQIGHNQARAHASVFTVDAEKDMIWREKPCPAWELNFFQHSEDRRNATACVPCSPSGFAHEDLDG